MITRPLDFLGVRGLLSGEQKPMRGEEVRRPRIESPENETAPSCGA